MTIWKFACHLFSIRPSLIKKKEKFYLYRNNNVLVRYTLVQIRAGTVLITTIVMSALLNLFLFLPKKYQLLLQL